MPKLPFKPTSAYREDKDYQEASNGEGDIYFGSFRKPPLADYFADIDKNKKNSQYFGHVFYPEKWTYEKNQSFWAGIIDKSRRLILVTDIEFYGRKDSGTMDELCWLEDNGYRFRPYQDPKDLEPKHRIWTIAYPPESSSAERTITNYRNEDGTRPPKITEILQQRVEKIKNEVCRLRESSKPADEDSGQPPEKSRRKGCSSEAASEAALKV